MEKKLMMPANYNVMSEEEMTYTEGGAGEAWLLGYSLGSLAVAAVSIGNMIWGVSESRKWIQANKGGKNVSDLASKGFDAYFDYMNKSVWNAVVGVFSALNAVTWWPVYAIAWITA